MIEERKGETVAKAGINEFSALRHKHNIEVSGFKKFSRIFLPVIPQPIALLVARDGKRGLIVVDGLCQCEGEEGLRQGSVIFGGTEVVLKLRVVILGVVGLKADRGPCVIL